MFQQKLFPQNVSDHLSNNYATQKDRFWADLVSGRIAEKIQDASFNKQVGSSQEVYNIMKPLFAQEPDVEKLIGIFLTRKNAIVSIELIARGSLTGAAVYPREIIKAMLAKKAASLVISHNHPSGNPEQSSEDIAITKHILFALHCIGAQLLDHVIVGANGAYSSFADMGALRTYAAEVTGFFNA